MSSNKYSRITTKTLLEMKSKGEKIAMLTAYDYSFAGLVDNSEIDVILVGDSASNVVAGHETTLPITLDQMIYHATSVVKAAKRALVIVDLPFGSYQSDPKEALRSAIRIMKESGAHGVKLEGGNQVKDSIERIIQAGIPVMGHLGLTPQSIYRFGSYNVRAKENIEAKMLLSEIIMLEKIGCFGLTEPNFGSNPSGMLTNAKKTDGGYILNGSKMWITNGSIADLAILISLIFSPFSLICFGSKYFSAMFNFSFSV